MEDHIYFGSPGPAWKLRSSLGARTSQEQLGAAKSRQEQPGAARSSQEQPGAASSSRQQPGAARSSQWPCYLCWNSLPMVQPKSLRFRVLYYQRLDSLSCNTALSGQASAWCCNWPCHLAELGAFGSLKVSLRGQLILTTPCLNRFIFFAVDCEDKPFTLGFRFFLKFLPSLHARGSPTFSSMSK